MGKGSDLLPSRVSFSGPSAVAGTRRCTRISSYTTHILHCIFLLEALSFRMPVRQSIPYSDGLYFLTLTCYRWLPLIEETNSYDAVYNWFHYLKSKSHHVTGYVIMPNHIHALIGFHNSSKSINRIVGEGKRFMAYEIVKRLKEKGAAALLTQLQKGVEKKTASVINNTRCGAIPLIGRNAAARRSLIKSFTIFISIPVQVNGIWRKVLLITRIVRQAFMQLESWNMLS